MNKHSLGQLSLTLKKILIATFALSFCLPAVMLMALFRGGGNIQETKTSR